MKEISKRHLITHSENISRDDAVRKLGILERIKEEDFKDIAYLSTAPALNKEDVLHFENLGVSSAELFPEEVRMLSGMPDILAVEEDVEMCILGFLSEEEANIPDEPLWNIQMVKAPQAWDRKMDGSGISLAILDTGIAEHPDLVIAGGASFVPDVTDYNDENGHGTHCAGIAAAIGKDNIYGVAPKCKLFAVKVLGKDGKGNSTWILAGMQWCIEQKTDIASMSLGGSSPPSVAYANAIKNCQNSGVTVVCAAGNSYKPKADFPWVNSPANSAKPFSPTEPDYQNASPIAVTAVDSQKNIASFSSRGGKPGVSPWNQVTVSAPGVDVTSTYLDGKYTKMSGTSMACPHVAGLAALILQKFPGSMPSAVWEKMWATASPLGVPPPAPNETFGYGLIDCDAATK